MNPFRTPEVYRFYNVFKYTRYSVESSTHGEFGRVDEHHGSRLPIINNIVIHQ